MKSKKNKLREKLEVDYIRYANCWEDPSLLTQAFTQHSINQPNPKKILSIASAGDNSFSLLCLNPELLVAVDTNQVQIHLCELKKVAIQHLTYKDCLLFLGFNLGNSRWELYQHLRHWLPETTRAYWDSHPKLIEKGLIHQGKFEKYFQFFSSKILPLIHQKKGIHELFRNKSAEEQHLFYHQTWNNKRWKLLFRLFFSKLVMGKFGRDPEFLKEVKVPVSAYIYQMAAQHLQHPTAQNNFILHYNLCGHFGSNLPHYMQEDNFTLIKKNIQRIRFFRGYAQEAGKQYGRFDAFNLSNIFEYMNDDLFHQCARDFDSMANPGARFCYWNLMVPRKMSRFNDIGFQEQRELSKTLKEIDKGFFYQSFVIEDKV